MIFLKLCADVEFGLRVRVMRSVFANVTRMRETRTKSCIHTVWIKLYDLFKSIYEYNMGSWENIPNTINHFTIPAIVNSQSQKTWQMESLAECFYFAICVRLLAKISTYRCRKKLTCSVCSAKAFQHLLWRHFRWLSRTEPYKKIQNYCKLKVQRPNVAVKIKMFRNFWRRTEMGNLNLDDRFSMTLQYNI